MPKTSAIERNKHRKQLVEKFKAKRAELKAILANPKTTDVEFFTAQRKLAKLPRNSSPVRIRNRCSMSGRPHRPLWRLPHPVPRTRPCRQDSRRDEIFLVVPFAGGSGI